LAMDLSNVHTIACIAFHRGTSTPNPTVHHGHRNMCLQIPFDARVRISLDTNLVMIKENPDDGLTCAEAGRQVPLLQFATLDIRS
jgi:VTC domain